MVAETREPFKKRLKTIEASEEKDEEAEGADNDAEKNDDESSLYQHIKEAEKGTAETVDAATKVRVFLMFFDKVFVCGRLYNSIDLLLLGTS